jgi:hypothetical protein
VKVCIVVMLYNKSIRALDYATPTHGFFISSTQ